MFYSVEKFTKGAQALYLFSDYHLPTAKTNGKVNFTQRKELIAMARKMGAATIVEDEIGIAKQLSLFNSADFIRPTEKLSLAELVSANKLGGHTALLMLSHWLEQAQLPYTNIEFRYAPWRPLNITFTLMDTLKAKIRAYNDGHELNSYYQKKLAELEQIEGSCKPLFDEFRKSGLTIQQYVQSLSPVYSAEFDPTLQKLLDEASWDLAKFTERDKALTLFTRYCVLLLDIEILHAIAQSEDENIFVCIGGLHALNIKEGLALAGFTSKATMGQELGFDTLANRYAEPAALPITASVKKLNPQYAPYSISLKRIWVSMLLWCLAH